MSSTSFIRRPRFVVLDTSHYVELIADSISSTPERRRIAQRFIPDLVDKGWLPLLCWHHVEELLQHRDDQLVEARLQYLWSLPLMAWIQPTDPLAGPGSILDVFRTEVLVAHQNLGADAIKVRDLTRRELFSVGSGLAAIPKKFRNWAVLRSALEAQQQNARRITAISRWRATDIDDTLIRLAS